MSAGMMATFATIQTITNARILLAQIATPILIVLGNIGEILNIIIFSQRTFRNNACAIYFLVASCTRLFFINFTILLDGLLFGYDIDPSRRSLIFCKIKFYIFSVTSIIPPYLVVLACIDRFMLSSLNANARTWSRPRTAYRLIGVVSIFWILFSIHALIGATIFIRYGQPYCIAGEGSYSFFVAVYSIICIYLLPPILMIIFGLLTVINVRRAQRRIQPTGGRGYVQRKDRHLLRMLLFQVLITVVFTIPRGVFQMYTAVTINWEKDIVWQIWDVFFVNLALVTFHVPYCIAFYIYTLTASIFREELKRIVGQSFGRFFYQRQTQVTTVQTSTTRM